MPKLLLAHHGYLKSDRLRILSIIEYTALSIIGIVIATFLGGWLSVAPGVIVLEIAFVSSFLLIIASRLIRRRETTRSRRYEGDLKCLESVPVEVRLVCYGEAVELLPLKNLDAHFFEPVIISGSQPGIIDSNPSKSLSQ